MEKNFAGFSQVANDLIQEGRSFVSVQMVHTRGSAPQDMGARIIFTSNEIAFGTIGGGKIEAYCFEKAKGLLKDIPREKFVFEKLNLQRDIGMTCGGEVSVLYEVFSSFTQWNICLFGAGHVAQALVRYLLPLEMKLTCIDPRKDWLEKLPPDSKLTKIHSEDLANAVDSLAENTFIIMMTKGHATDLPILHRALMSEKKFPFIGVIGSKAKRAVMTAELIQLGVDKKLTEKFICPIGEKMGNNSPAEISISILSQLIKIRDEYFDFLK